MTRLLQKIFNRMYFEFLKLRIRRRNLKFVLLQSCNECSDEDIRLKEKYDIYTQEVSTPEMAASFECLSLIRRMCRNGSFKKILDLGSGFSSFAFRQYAASKNGVSVWSVDDDESWIDKTRAFLEQSELPSSNLMMLDKFLSSNETDFDLVFLDLNFVHLRKNYIQLAIDRCKSGGVIIFDDVHKSEFMYDLLVQTRELPVRFYDIKSLTVDRFGRFALLGLKS